MRIQTREPSSEAKLSRNDPTGGARWLSRSRVLDAGPWPGLTRGGGEPVFPRPLGDPRAPVPRGARRGTLRALGGALATSAGPLCAAHLAYSQPIHTGPCAAHLRPLACLHPPRENPPNDRLHPTHDPGHRVPPTPDHRPSRPRPDALITVGSEGVRLMARARPL